MNWLKYCKGIIEISAYLGGFNMVAKRVRQIREGSDYLVSSPKNEDIVVALREVAAGRIGYKANGGEEEEPQELE